MLADRPSASWILAGLSFLESILIPLPPDALLIPMSVMKRHRAFFYAALTTFFSVAGGCTAYLIGAFFMESMGMSILRFYGMEEELVRYRALYADYGLWIVLAGGFTPIPYKVITLSAGAGFMNPLVFIVASFLSRGARFFLLSFLCRLFGKDIEALLESMLARSQKMSSLLFLLLFITTLVAILILVGFSSLL